MRRYSPTKWCNGAQPRKCTQCSSPGDGETSCKVWLASGERCPCSNKARTRNPLKFAGVPQTPEPISATIVGRSSPYCADMCRRYCCLTSFFPIIDACRSCEDSARQSSAIVHKWRFLRPVFSVSRLQYVSDLHPKFALRSCVQVWHTYNLRRLRSGEEKKIE